MKHHLIAVFVAALFVSPACPQEAQGEASASITSGVGEEPFTSITAAVKAEQYEKALELAKAFAEKSDSSEDLARVILAAGDVAEQKKLFKIAAGFFRLLVDKFPKSGQASAARAELVACYTITRKLDACITQAKSNLELDPDSQWAEYWSFLIAQSYFRLYDYTTAKGGLEAFLAKYPNGKYAENARSCLDRIDPPWEVDEHGIISYTGKYDGDIRLQAALKAFPADMDAGLRTLEQRLGLDLKPYTNMLFEFKDAGSGTRGQLVAMTHVIGRINKPTTVVRFYTEYVVAQPDNYRKTLVHEMKHAGFQGIMGYSYDDLPVWVREGLAVWGSNDVATRLQLVLCNQIIGGTDPFTVLDGIEDPDHNEADYMEDVLAFEWLESKKPDNVKAFCRRLVKGESYREIWADLSGMSYTKAMVEADTYCRNRVTTTLGDAYTAFEELHKAQETVINKDKPSNEKWLNEGGQAAFEKWLADNPEHPAAPFARFCLARSLITAGQFAAGRELLQQILDEDALRSTILDDAQFWIGVSYNWEQDSANAAAAFGVLLRDFSCSQSAKQVAGKFPAAGPITR